MRIKYFAVIFVLLLFAACESPDASTCEVAGIQESRHLAPEDLCIGRVLFNAGQVEVASEGSFAFTPESVWGTYTYRIVKTGVESNELEPDPPVDRQQLTAANVRFEDVASGEVLSLEGRITDILEPGRRYRGVFTFAGEDVTAEIDVVAVEHEKPMPTLRNLRYGPHWRHTVDVYRPEGIGDAVTPVVVFIHGGGWGGLDKSNVSGRLPKYLPSGITVAAVNYRYTRMAHEAEPVDLPVKAPLGDAARAVQFIRFKADELGIDPDNMGAFGGSAGGASSLWLGLHDDMADPDSDDPVARQSTRLTYTGSMQAQTTLDPVQMREWIGPVIQYGGASRAFLWPNEPEDNNEAFDLFLAQRDSLLPLIKEYSAYYQASADDPPVYLDYHGRANVPPEPGDYGLATHHPMFGVKLKEKLDSLGVQAYYVADGEPMPRYEDVHAFLVANLTGAE